MQQMVQELKEAGAIIEEEDFLNYTTIEREPVESYYDDLRVIGTSAPGGGAVLSLMLNILQGQLLFLKNTLLYNFIYTYLHFSCTCIILSVCHITHAIASIHA